MHIPEREKKTREDIIKYIRKCAKQYVPEWRYDPENPDAGTALVSLFADMMYDNIRQFNQSAIGDMFSFFNGMNAKLLPAKPAEGFITFTLPAGFDGEEEVPRGTKVLAQGSEGPVVFETQEEVLVRQMELRKIYLSNPKEDVICEVFDKEQEAKPDFFLFQGKGENLQRHIIYFCFSGGLGIMAGAKAELSFRMIENDRSMAEWDQDFQEEAGIRFSYGTAEGYRYFKEDDVENEYDCQDGVLYFRIAGGENGIAPKEEFESSYVIRAEISDAKRFSKVCLTSVALIAHSQNVRPDFIHVNGTDEEPEDFLVFGRTPSVYDEFYIASEEVFGKAGAKIQVEFDLDFVRIPLELIAAGETVWKTVMKKRDFVPEKEYDLTVCEVAWEYYNGYGWTRLKGAYGYRKLFEAGEDERGQRVHMEFTCPSDICPALINSAETYAIRARIIRMNNAYKTRGAYIAPVAGRVLLSYDYSAAPLMPSRIIRDNHMERQVISEEEMKREGFYVSLCDQNPDRKTACYLGFYKPLTDGPLKFLFVMRDTMQQRMPEIEWQYLSGNGWETLHPVDGTKGFHHTGLVSWFGRRDMKQEVLFGQRLYWIRILDVADAYGGRNLWDSCPKIEGIYPNSTSILGIETVEEEYRIAPFAQEKVVELPFTDIADISVKVSERLKDSREFNHPVWAQWTEVKELGPESGEKKEYVIDRHSGVVTFPKYMDTSCLNEQGEIEVLIRYGHCQGEKGNLPAGAINRMDKSIGFINSSYNPVAALGGISREEVHEALWRNAQILRHGYRCVSAKDYEDMAWEATRNISRAACFSGFDQYGKKEPGAVTLVVFPKEYEKDFRGFEKTKAQIYRYLSGHMDENILNLGKFHIVRPELLRIDTRASIEVSVEGEVFRVRKRALEALETFLHPLKGNFYGEGWEIGQFPGPNQVEHALKRVEGVRHVRQLALRKFIRGRFEELEVSEEKDLPFYLLPESGNHEILIEMQSF